VLGAWYLLTMLQHALYGPLKEPHHGEEQVADMNVREWLALGPIAILCLWIGVHPGPVLDLIEPDVEAVAALYDTTPGEATALLQPIEELTIERGD
jgi:NADH-quinone oxidoreductase subunit M